MARLRRIANPSQHVCDGISHISRALVSVSSSRLPVPSVRSAASRIQAGSWPLEAGDWQLATDSPAALRHARHVPFEGQLTEAEAAQRELAQEGARAATALAAVAQANLELGCFGFFGDLGGCGHIY